MNAALLLPFLLKTTRLAPARRRCFRVARVWAVFFFAAFVWVCSPVSASAAGQGSEAPSEADQEQSPLVPVFQFSDVEQKARELAGKAFQNPDGQVPDFLLALGETEWNRIRFRDENSLWRNEGLPFEVRFFHPGFIYNRVVAMNVVERGRASRIPFGGYMFDLGDSALAGRVSQTQLDFAGFRLHFPLNGPEKKDEVAVFLGATYFRSVGKNSGYGLASRGVALNTGLPEGEEFPYFREFWLVRPEPEDRGLTLYALMDSPSMTGAFHFVVTPGTSTLMEVKSTLFPRKGAPVPTKIGLAPLTSMYLYSERENGSPSDYRPEVHNSDGLLFTPGGRDWAWRPLANPSRLAVNSFALQNPRGFGLLQRDDNFDHYQDIEARFDRRPSLWIEPQGDWGTGRLELIEIPSRIEIHENILAFWVPEKKTENGSGNNGNGNGGVAAFPSSFSLAYKMYWMDPNVTPHDLGRAVATRMVREPDKGRVRFIIDFESAALNALPADTGLSSVIETPQQCPVLEKRLIKNPVTGGWRLDFTVALSRSDGVVQSILSARDVPPRLRFRALLKKGENLPDPLTEAWVYDMP